MMFDPGRLPGVDLFKLAPLCIMPIWHQWQVDSGSRTGGAGAAGGEFDAGRDRSYTEGKVRKKGGPLMSLLGPRFTYEDYKLLPEDRRYEIVEGELLVTPAPSTRHQGILVRLILRMATFVEAGNLGRVLPAPTDVILANESIVQPDLLFVTRGRQGIIDPGGGVNGSPDLVVEILSPSTASRDQVVKRKLYGKYGVREYWIVDPTAHSIEVLTLEQGGLDTWRVFPAGSSLTSPLLPGLSLSVDDIVAD